MSFLRRCAHLALRQGQRSEAIACTGAYAPISLSPSPDSRSLSSAVSPFNFSPRPGCEAAALPKRSFVSHGACHAGNGVHSRLYGMQAVDPWQDKIGSNFRGGNEKYINVPIDEFSAFSILAGVGPGEHVSITNEIEKTLQEAGSVDDVLEIVSQHKDAFEGPNIATTLMALHHLTADKSAEEHRRLVHGRAEFEMLLRMVEERMTFDVFTLMQTLQSLVGLHLQDEELLSNISARLTTLVQVRFVPALGAPTELAKCFWQMMGQRGLMIKQTCNAFLEKASDAKQLIKLIKRMCKSEYVPTRNLLEAIHRRVNTIKGTVHPETCSDIERAVTKLAVLMSEGRSKQKAMSAGQ